jgi:acyl dehydratase
MGLSITPVISWAGSSSAIVDYSVRFTKPVVVPSDVAAEVKVTATIGVIDLEKKQARVDLITSFEGSSVLGKAQAWVQL